MDPSQSSSPKVPRLESRARKTESPRAGPSHREEIRSRAVSETDPGRVSGKNRERFFRGAWLPSRVGGSSSRSDEFDTDEPSSDSRSAGTPLTESDIEWNNFGQGPETGPKCATVRAAERNPSSNSARSSASLDKIPQHIFKKLPSLIMSSSMGNLVESYQSEFPRVEIKNLFHIKYEVERILGYQLSPTGTPRFRVRWKGWSEKWDSWEPEKQTREDATPALRLHISRFFLESFREKKAREYFREYLLHAIVRNETPDCFLMSKLTNHTLEVSGTHVLAPNSVILKAMLRNIESNSKPRSQHDLLEAFDGSLLRAIEFMQARLRALNDYEKWRHRIQRSEPAARIKVENLVDCEKLPANFAYITDYDFSKRVVTKSPASFCECQSSSCFVETSPGHYSISKSENCHRAYSPTQRLRRELESKYVFECNSLCKCDLRCGSRVTQRGLQVHLTIFRTARAEWRVKAGAPLEKGTFVGEYFGEYIPVDEADVRDSAHLLNVKPQSPSNTKYAIDGAMKGNITHFFTRSADPNLAITYVFIDNHEEHAPRVAFFTSRDISEGEELSFDPHEDLWKTKS